MIEFIAILVLLVFAVFLLYPLLGSLHVFLINFVILAMLAYRIPSDIRKRGMYVYYLVSTLFATVFFILSKTSVVAGIINFFQEIFMLKVTLAAVIIFLIAHLSRLIHKKITSS